MSTNSILSKIRQEIERRIKLYDGNNTQEMWIGNTYRAVLSFLDTLSEEPDKSLKEAAEDAVCMAFGGDPAYYGNKAEFSVNECMRLFKAGAEWQASQMPMPEDTVLFQKGVAEGRRLEREDMMKDAVEGYVNYYEDSGGILMAEAQVGCPYHNGDKVRIVILKEEEE